MRRYIAKESFIVPLKGGLQFHVSAAAIGPDGLPGLPDLPKEILKRKDLMEKFFVVELDPVEKATAAPGEKRAAPRKRTTKK